MQPFMKNVAVEYAAKALPDSELAKALQDLKDTPVLTEDNVADIVKLKPKIIRYINNYYVLYTDADNDLYYAYLNAEEKVVYWINVYDNEFTFYEYEIAAMADVGTKLYKHNIQISNDLLKSAFEVPGSPYNTFVIISTSAKPLTTVTTNAGVYVIGANVVNVDVIAIYCNMTGPIKPYFVNPEYSGLAIVGFNNGAFENIFEATGTVSDTVTTL